VGHNDAQTSPSPGIPRFTFLSSPSSALMSKGQDCQSSPTVGKASLQITTVEDGLSACSRVLNSILAFNNGYVARSNVNKRIEYCLSCYVFLGNRPTTQQWLHCYIEELSQALSTELVLGLSRGARWVPTGWSVRRATISR
jgi:hypothetical protein